jgi:hypothetical protein
MTVICLDNMKRPNPLKTATIVEIEPLGVDRRFNVTTVEFVAELAKSLGRSTTYSHDYRLVLGVFYAEISDGSIRVMSMSICRENGLSQHPLFNETLQQSIYDADTDAFFQEYRERQQKVTTEQLFEMRSAFGPGEVAIDVASGRLTKMPGRKE